MAYAAILSLTQILRQVMDPDRHVLHSKQQIESLQEKVSCLLDFLEKYSVYTDKVVKDLEIKIRDAAYRAEDIIDLYISTSINSSKVSGRKRLRRCQTFCQDLDRVIEETHSIQQEAMDINCMLDSNDVQQRKTLPVGTSRFTFTDGYQPVVGLVEDSMKIKDWLTSSSSKRDVISIVGMGGIGKTTFARNLFDDSLIVYHFQVRAWVTVSQDCRIDEIIVGLVASLNRVDPEMRNVSSADQAERLYKSLKGHRYLIMMDDVWDTKVWDDLKRLFPDDNNGSRIVFTTRLTNVGVHAASFDRLHDMSFLTSDESWNLFCKRGFGGERCPPDLEEIGRQIVRNCKGLPLSIVVVGGLLSMNKTASYWKTISTSLNSILATDGSQCSTIFSLSYNHLPAHLKPCFLYFASFPEDYEIRRSKLITLWVAEGFIKPNESKSLEDSAEEYLGDLVNRSLIKVSKRGGGGKVKTYIIHDLLRDFCTTEARKETFLHVTRWCTFIHPEGISSERRISIQTLYSLRSIEHILNSNGPPLPTRSLFLYDRSVEKIVSERSFELLRVLDMQNGMPHLTFPMEVVGLVQLRYLSVSFQFGAIPACISSIRGLQTLVIHGLVGKCHLPLEVWMMPHLRHVKITNGLCHLPDPPNSGENFVILVNLHTLSHIINFRFTDEIIKRIPKLKKRRVWYDENIVDWSQFHLSNIVCLNELESLQINYFDSKIALTPNFKFPATLKKIILAECPLRSEDLTVVGSLPNLEVLKLYHNAFEDHVWEPNEGEFRELKFLELHSLELAEWRADDSHFPKLKCLRICMCYKLEAIPIEIGNIQTLEMIELVGVGPSAVVSAELILDEQRSFDNEVLQVRIDGWSGSMRRQMKYSRSPFIFPTYDSDFAQFLLK